MKSGKKYKILSIETSGSVCGAALSVGREIVAEFSYRGSNLHDRLLAESVKRLLDDSDIKFGDLDAAAVSSGPGSFTGLRIGASLAKGICFDGKIRLIAVPTMQSLAFAASEFARPLGYEKITTLVYAYQNIFYSQEFDPNGAPIGEILVEEIEGKACGKSPLIIGPGLAQFPELKRFESLDELSAAKIAKLAWGIYERGEFVDPADFVPNYSQDFVPKTSKKKLSL